jgi:parallel beta-helix repeat protein
VRSLNDSVTIKNCVIVGAYDAEILGAIDMRKGNGSVIRGNTITKGCEDGITFSRYAAFENVIIEDNLIENLKSNHPGIAMRGTFNNNIIISGNTVYNNSEYGMLLEIYNSTITENNVSNNGVNGILITEENDNTISNNIISNTICPGNGDSAIRIGSDNSVVSNNRVTNTTKTGQYLPTSIYLRHAQNVGVIHNAVLDNDGWGIRAGEANNATIKDNVVLNNSVKKGMYNWDHNCGIYPLLSNSSTLTNNTASSNCTFTGNTVSNNSEDGIRLEQSCNCTLTDNIVRDNKYGIFLYSSSNNTIYNNYFNNTYNAYDYGNNAWNITKTLGTSIAGSPYLGGNCWSDYIGNDTDGDYLGDTSLPYNSSGRIKNGGDCHPLICDPIDVSVSDIVAKLLVDGENATVNAAVHTDAGSTFSMSQFDWWNVS